MCRDRRPVNVVRVAPLPAAQEREELPMRSQRLALASGALYVLAIMIGNGLYEAGKTGADDGAGALADLQRDHLARPDRRPDAGDPRVHRVPGLPRRPLPDAAARASGRTAGSPPPRWAPAWSPSR